MAFNGSFCCRALSFQVGRLPLHYVPNAGRLDAVRFLVVECDCPVDSRDLFGNRVLHLAAMFDFPEITKHLIMKHKSVNEKDLVGCTPLDLALESGREEVAAVLLDA